MIPFALSQHDTLVSVHDVRPGLACNCRCPACKAPLIAKKGNRNAHHFAHYRQPECTLALESSLHQLAKTLLAGEQMIVLPPVYLHSREAPVEYARLFQFGGVRLEQFVAGMIPDIVLETAHEQVLVEVAVHHPAGSDKVWRLQQARLVAIEIDVKTIYLELSGLGKGADLSAFTERIVHGTRHKKWLFNPKQHAMELSLRNGADRKKVKEKVIGDKVHHQVDGCALKKRFRRHGPLDGRSYANVFWDCLQCPHCFEIEYQKKHVGYRQIATDPKFVYCLG